ncbi:hypothetical protein [Streptomyces sioyaensis]|uniref:hypothetical protein n=1 Tax=Streptomyces sioyaensis TaxID=67364 RepID=UPI0037AE2F1E
MKPVISVRALLIALAVVSALLVAVVAGVLSAASGTGTPGAVLYGGGAFVLWMTLSVSLLSALHLLD